MSPMEKATRTAVNSILTVAGGHVEKAEFLEAMECYNAACHLIKMSPFIVGGDEATLIDTIMGAYYEVKAAWKIAA